MIQCKKQKCNRISDLILAFKRELDPSLVSLSNELTSCFTTSSFYLYGSRAKTLNQPKSDFDLMLFIPKSEAGKLTDLHNRLSKVISDLKPINDRHVANLVNGNFDALALKGHRNGIEYGIHVMLVEKLTCHFTPLKKFNKLLFVRRKKYLPKKVTHNFKVSATSGKVREVDISSANFEGDVFYRSPGAFRIGNSYSVPVFANKIMTSLAIHDQLGVDDKVKGACFYSTVKALGYADPNFLRNKRFALRRLLMVLRIKPETLNPDVKRDIIFRLHESIERAKRFNEPKDAS